MTSQTLPADFFADTPMLTCRHCGNPAPLYSDGWATCPHCATHTRNTSQVRTEIAMTYTAKITARGRQSCAWDDHGDRGIGAVDAEIIDREEYDR